VRATLVDSNVLLDVMSEDERWSSWSRAALAHAGETSRLIVNPIIYAEVSVRFSRIEALDEALPPELFEREPLPYEAAFLAEKAFAAYRKRGGEKAKSFPISSSARTPRSPAIAC
jgi:predicted nucleic acid-binding protein